MLDITSRLKYLEKNWSQYGYPTRTTLKKSTLIREITTSANLIVEHWKDHEKKRDEDIEAARFITSLKNRTHSYGKFALFEKSEFSDFTLDVKS